jgi:ribosomal protein S18 acetylase RimI-like enzyme
MDDHRIEVATANDIPALIAFGKQEFARAFGHLYTAADLESYLQEAYCTEIYVTWINSKDDCIYIAFSGDHAIAGYVLGGLCSLPLENCGFDDKYASTCREVKRMYIHPSAFGSGLSDILLLKILKWLQSDKEYSPRIYLGVYSENGRAIKFYNRHHFEKVGEYGFVVGDLVDREFICHWKGFERQTAQTPVEATVF